MTIQRPPTVRHGKTVSRGREVFKCWKILHEDFRIKVFEVKDSFSGLGSLEEYEADSETEWETLEIPSKCQFYTEHCMSEWNENEKGF